MARMALTALGLSLAPALATPSVAQAPQHQDAAMTANTTQPANWGFDTAGMDRAVAPGDDFFTYADGTYLKNLQIPADMSSYGPFRALYQESLARQRTLLDDLTKAATPSTSAASSTDAKLARYYSTFMDSARANALGATPLAADLASIRAIRTQPELAQAMGKASQGMGFSTFALGVEQDQRDPERYMLMIDQGMSIGVGGGLSLPDQRYYTDPAMAPVRKAWQGYIAHMLALEGWPEPERYAEAIMALESKLSAVQRPREKTRDATANFNPMTVDELCKAAPDFDWKAFLLAAGVPAKGLGGRVVDVRQPEAIKAMAAVLQATPLPVLQAWLAYQLGNNAAPYLSDAFSKAAFNFNGHTLAGIKQQPARWKRGVSATNNAMGMALGKLYVQHYFPPSAKADITKLAERVKAAFRKRLEGNSWMDAPTRERALRKLDRFAIQVGYPDKWRDYSALEVVTGDSYGNASRAAAFNWHHELDRLDKPVDRSEWFMTPQTVNAYNDPTMNEIVFPAAILQPPFYDPKGDGAVNYGGIGGVIGHEMSHGFDDQGRHYDEHGRLRDWWSPASAKAFEALAKRLGQQYDAVEVLPGLHVNGSMTMGENIADLGGLNLALQAWKDQEGPQADAKAHGFTGRQRVFLGWAQVWREKQTPEALKAQVLSNEHAPAVARVNMPVHNIGDWYDVFSVQPGQKLWLAPDGRVQIW
nr:M13 family metallopeptidase [Formicincola oecophyllae]